MADFEIVGGGQGNLNEMTRTLLESKYRQDSLAAAREELKSRERQATLDRASKTSDIELEQKLLKKRETAQANEQKEVIAIAGIRGLLEKVQNPRDFEALRPQVEALLPEEEVKAWEQEATNRGEAWAEQRLRAEQEQNADRSTELAMREALGSVMPGGFGQMPGVAETANQAELAAIQRMNAETDKAKLPIMEEQNRIESRKADAMFEGIKVDREKIASNEKISMQNLRTEISRTLINTQGNLGSALIDSMQRIETNPALDADERLAAMIRLGSLSKGLFQNANRAAQASGEAADETTRAIIQSVGGSDASLGSIIDGYLEEYETKLKKAGKTEDAKKVTKLRHGTQYNNFINDFVQWGTDPEVGQSVLDELKTLGAWVIGGNADIDKLEGVLNKTGRGIKNTKNDPEQMLDDYLGGTNPLFR